MSTGVTWDGGDPRRTLNLTGMAGYCQGDSNRIPPPSFVARESAQAETRGWVGGPWPPPEGRPLGGMGVCRDGRPRPYQTPHLALKPEGIRCENDGAGCPSRVGGHRSGGVNEVGGSGWCGHGHVSWDLKGLGSAGAQLVGDEASGSCRRLVKPMGSTRRVISPSSFIWLNGRTVSRPHLTGSGYHRRVGSSPEKPSRLVLVGR